MSSHYLKFSALIFWRYSWPPHVVQLFKRNNEFFVLYLYVGARPMTVRYSSFYCSTICTLQSITKACKYCASKGHHVLLCNFRHFLIRLDAVADDTRLATRGNDNGVPSGVNVARGLNSIRLLLPDFFTGVTVYIDRSVEESRLLERLVIA